MDRSVYNFADPHEGSPLHVPKALSLCDVCLRPGRLDCGDLAPCGGSPGDSSGMVRSRSADLDHGGIWVAFSGLLILGGRLGDLVGMSRTFVSGLTIFGLASLAGGFASSFTFLLAARFAQGVGASLTAPAAPPSLEGSLTTPATEPGFGPMGWPFRDRRGGRDAAFGSHRRRAGVAMGVCSGRDERPRLSRFRRPRRARPSQRPARRRPIPDAPAHFRTRPRPVSNCTGPPSERIASGPRRPIGRGDLQILAMSQMEGSNDEAFRREGRSRHGRGIGHRPGDNPRLCPGGRNGRRRRPPGGAAGRDGKARRRGQRAHRSHDGRRHRRIRRHRLMESIASRYGRLDVAFNNAGISGSTRDF